MKKIAALVFAFATAISHAATVNQILVGARFETAAESRGANLLALALADQFRDAVRTVAEPHKGPKARLYVDMTNPLLLASAHRRMRIDIRGLADANGGDLQVEAKTRDGWRFIVGYEFRRERTYSITVGSAQRYLEYGSTKLRITMRSSEPILFRIDQVRVGFLD